VRIAIVTATTTDRVTGVAEYLINLVANLQAIDARNEYHVITTRDNRYMFDLHAPNFAEVTLPLRQRPWLLMRGLYHAWQAAVFPLWCAWRRIDLVHLPNTLLVSPLLSSIVTIHDVTELKTRKYSGLRTFVRRTMIESAIRFSRTIIADSDSTAADLRAMGARRVTTIHLGFDRTAAGRAHDAEAARRCLDQHGVEAGRYAIAIGTLMKHKNLPNLVRAFARLPAGIAQKLVIVGARDNAYDDVAAAIAAAGGAANVALLDYVTMEEKEVLLRNAGLLCLISAYEGFGLPVLEAQAVGVPVLISNVSSLPEIAGDGAVAVDPDDVGAIAAALERCFADAGLRRTLVAAGHANVLRFSWRRCAEETLAAYERAGAAA